MITALYNINLGRRYHWRPCCNWLLSHEHGCPAWYCSNPSRTRECTLIHLSRAVTRLKPYHLRFFFRIWFMESYLGWQYVLFWILDQWRLLYQYIYFEESSIFQEESPFEDIVLKSNFPLDWRCFSVFVRLQCIINQIRNIRKRILSSRIVKNINAKHIFIEIQFGSEFWF